MGEEDSQGGDVMRGTVRIVSLQTGFVAVETDRGYTVIEPLSGEPIEVGDVISGNGLEKLGGATLWSETRQREVRAFVQDVYGSLERASRLLEG